MISRRTLITGAVAAGATLATSAIWLKVRTQDPHVADETDALLEALSDLVIPATDTPGALAVGVPAFVRVAVENGQSGASLQDLAVIAVELDRRAAARFLDLERTAQAPVLTSFDADVYAQQPPRSPWPAIKKLILLGYYSSEVGATQELHYELVPGRFDADIALTPEARAYSSDWIGVS